jgi:hypothetical protein
VGSRYIRIADAVQRRSGSYEPRAGLFMLDVKTCTVKGCEPAPESCR